MLRKFLEWLGPKLPQYTIPQDDGSPYLTRYYLLLKDRSWGNLYLHKFHASDFDKDEIGVYLYHNHPTHFSFGFVLVNLYIEYRLKEGEESPSIKIVLPFHFNFLRRRDFHRVVLIGKEPVWTLFFTWKRLEDWYFYNPKTKMKMHYSFKGKAIA